MTMLFLTTDPATGERQAVPLEVAKAFNGIEDKTKFAVAYDVATRTVSVVYSSGAAVWVGGKKFIKSGSVSVQHSATFGQKFFYYDTSGTLVVSNTAWDELTVTPLVGVYYKASNPVTAFVTDEMHPALNGMDNATGIYLHKTQGTKALSGFEISGYTLDTAGTDALGYAVGSGVISDEDLYHSVGALDKNTSRRVFFYVNSYGWMWDDTSLTGVLDNTFNPYYNDLTSGQRTITSDNRWVNYYVIAIPELTGTRQICIVMGQTVYTSLADAQAEDPNSSILHMKELSEEFVFLYRMTYRRVSGSSPANTQLSAVQAVRANNASMSGGFDTSDHQSLSNRGAEGAHPGVSISLSTGGFDRLLSSEEKNVQLALQKINDNAAHKSIDEEFVSADQTTFALATDITDNDKIKVFVDGRLMREGAENAWTRDSAANQITTTEAVPAGKWVLVEIHRG